ncbi:uncharacterized protein BX663DRAFT_331096 [Cokeromyces recurvatus]|uniref:uncharacterized protein n=1 Tax=Cokeromyces recurvatus TaxID=90255 RepID=UPI00221F1055|nr:uncharacterized protein BX663DRAFT_331096 [Cokeromyces recurvatus]KAI7904877.1 hypothetical protein BX663DRAFT_331096 [Cokeromyces recurvatus]
MYSPNRVDGGYGSIIKASEKPGLVASPLRTIATPIYEAVKSAHTKATRDFDRFYGNLQAKLTPRTSNSYIQKRTAETSERLRAILNQRRTELDSHNASTSRTSLTPLIERHTLREDSQAKYNYPSRNPFYQESESDIAETPSLIEHYADDTPISYISLDKQPSQPNTFSSPRKTMRKSTLTPNRQQWSMKLQEKLTEERRRMDRLHKNLLKIRRQSSLLADELSTTNSRFEQGSIIEKDENFADEDTSMSIVSSPEHEDRKEEEDAFSIISSPSNNTNRNRPSSISYNHSNSHNGTSSISYNQSIKSSQSNTCHKESI